MVDRSIIIEFLRKKKKQNTYLWKLKLNNQLIEFRDIFIGATALEMKLLIITLNETHFKRIKRVEIYGSKKLLTKPSSGRTILPVVEFGL